MTISRNIFFSGIIALSAFSLVQADEVIPAPIIESGFAGKLNSMNPFPGAAKKLTSMFADGGKINGFLSKHEVGVSRTMLTAATVIIFAGAYKAYQLFFAEKMTDDVADYAFNFDDDFGADNDDNANSSKDEEDGLASN